MKKYLPAFIILIGLLVNLLVLAPQIYIHSQQTVVGLILGITGFILAIFNYKKGYKTYQKIAFILGGIINIYPVLYFTFLFFALG
ncbi:TPA: hypothetical protein I0H52_RS14050 [Enterococcus faecalis]|uniref:hypothetical protein n=1 Tax=Enterococcus faecalis TaxID=1351 RepID=UPI00026D7A37|nr:hypothetical protein [Enterococcus faecalis]AFO45850.1 hypothetical protein EFD32_pB0066 [Enterococcus faecalis D32]HBI1967232.1 hypothetical protein [Enterococcus faecalis]HBI2029722.1 hypothetical protein [Enterococcus faecalis]HBI2043340.1 hypothetical protein [Enterococcus faecalis]HBI2061918.1 hypothetical protein [Enterococcus faecalis]